MNYHFMRFAQTYSSSFGQQRGTIQKFQRAHVQQFPHSFGTSFGPADAGRAVAMRRPLANPIQLPTGRIHSFSMTPALLCAKPHSHCRHSAASQKARSTCCLLRIHFQLSRIVCADRHSRPSQTEHRMFRQKRN
ncbi:unnamed protein product [Protopolystoma xenopodis]|uniref:Uncharacterized protein n=1 Tax=Protopolystoma xenopodis TaxID=117903 RepID=A0A3S5CIK8_9PLAT|nr:unnamed protein product [Protopolystoma xenopodis]